MDYTRIFRKTIKGVYRCVCQETFETFEDAEYHLDEDGFCENGIRQYNDEKYECKCGATDMHRSYVEFTHYYNNKGNCIRKKDLKNMTFCASCNKHFHNISWYERHIVTVKHENKLNNQPIYDLECKVCNIKCRGQKEISTHLQTKKHLEREKTSEPHLDLECKVCNIKCRGQKEMKTHLTTKKHIKNELNLKD